MENLKLQAAKEYVNNGYVVFPLVPNKKKPLIVKWQTKASNDPRQIEQWWLDNPDANIGVKSGELVVLDVDVKDGQKQGPLNLDIAGIEIPTDAPMVRTPSKGQHYYFKTTPDNVIRNSQDFPVDDCDIRGSGGYIVGIGSTVDGREYTGDVKLFEQLPEAPEWLFKPQYTPTITVSSTLPSSSTNDIQTALDKVDPEELNEQDWYKVGMAIQSELPTEEGLELFDTWSQRDETLGNDGLPRYKPDECAAKWKSWSPDGRIKIGTLYHFANWSPPTPLFDPVADSTNGTTTNNSFTFPNQLNEEVMVQTMQSYSGDSLRYSDGGWVVWDGENWLKKEDADAKLFTMYHGLIDWLRTEASYAFSGDTQDGTKELAYLASAKQTRFREDIYRAFKAALGISITTWDSNQDIFAVQNGVVELDTGVFRMTRKEDYIIRTAKTSYKKDAECPMWVKFITESTGGDPEMIEYLQRLSGYFLTADVSLHELYFLFGPTRTGKSTYVDVMYGLLGGYCSMISAKTLLEGASDGAAGAEIASVENARMVRTDELPKTGAINAALVKSLTGDAVIAGNAKYKKPRTFEATGKLVMYGNDKPSADALLWFVK